MFAIHTNQRKYLLRASSPAERERWVEAIRLAVANARERRSRDGVEGERGQDASLGNRGDVLAEESKPPESAAESALHPSHEVGLVRGSSGQDSAIDRVVPAIRGRDTHPIK